MLSSLQLAVWGRGCNLIYGFLVQWDCHSGFLLFSWSLGCSLVFLRSSLWLILCSTSILQSLFSWALSCLQCVLSKLRKESLSASFELYWLKLTHALLGNYKQKRQSFLIIVPQKQSLHIFWINFIMPLFNCWHSYAHSNEIRVVKLSLLILSIANFQFSSPTI